MPPLSLLPSNALLWRAKEAKILFVTSVLLYTIYAFQIFQKSEICGVGLCSFFIRLERERKDMGLASLNLVPKRWAAHDGALWKCQVISLMCQKICERAQTHCNTAPHTLRLWSMYYTVQYSKLLNFLNLVFWLDGYQQRNLTLYILLFYLSFKITFNI